jgi:hypothetical protein
MDKLSTLVSKKGISTLIGYDFNNSFEQLVQQGEVDCFIVSSEDGFSPLGAAKKFFSRELNIAESKISHLARFNRFLNQEVSLIGLPNQNTSSKLRGVILAAGESSDCYEQFATAFYGKPYRDFYYNVAYESISYAAHVLGARKIAISHLSGSHHFHKDIATCIVEALTHFCDRVDSPEIDSFLFVGCCIEESHFSGIQQLSMERGISEHHDIRLGYSLENEFEVVSLNWDFNQSRQNIICCRWNNNL